MSGRDAYIDAAAALLGLPIDPAHRPGVSMFLGMAADMAAILDEAPLDEDELAPLPVYAPPADGRP